MSYHSTLAIYAAAHANRAAPEGAITLTRSTLGELLEKAATRGLEVGRKGTEGDFTAAGIAVHVLMDEGLLPARTAKPTEETQP